MKSTNVRVEFKGTTLFISQEIANWQRKLFIFHKKTLHGGVALTMTAVLDHYWIPKLRQLTKV